MPQLRLYLGPLLKMKREAVSPRDIEIQAQEAMGSKRWSDAVALWTQLLPIKGYVRPRIYRKLARALWRNGERRAADAILNDGLARFPDNQELLLEQAELAADIHEWEKAAENWRIIIDHDEERGRLPHPYIKIANSYLQLRDVVSYHDIMLEGLHHVDAVGAKMLMRHVSGLGTVGKRLSKKIARLYPSGLRTKLRKAFDWASRSYRLDLYEKYYPRTSLVNGFFFNLGAGRFYHPYWTNIDFSTEYYRSRQSVPFVNYDMRSGMLLPIADDQAEAFYCSHVIEHIEDEHVEHAFREVLRCLRKGGIFRVTCPNADLMLRSVVQQRLEFWEWRREFLQRSIANPSAVSFFVREIATGRKRKMTEEDVLALLDKGRAEDLFSALTRGLAFSAEQPGLHINWWNPAKLVALLTRVGFSHVWLSGRGQSLCLPMQNGALFDITSPRISFYVEAAK